MEKGLQRKQKDMKAETGNVGKEVTKLPPKTEVMDENMYLMRRGLGSKKQKDVVMRGRRGKGGRTGRHGS